MSPIKVFAISAGLLVSSAALANPDDLKWVGQCLQDNAGEGQPTAVVKAYCECMNDKMPESEERSITEWEKAHPKEMAECEASSGWKQ